MKFKLFSSPKLMYKQMLEDINKAEKYIYLETYIYSRDEIGNQFRQALVKKAKQGVKVLLLIDALGSQGIRTRLSKIFNINKHLGLNKAVDKEYFSDLEQAGGEVRFFKKIQYVFKMFEANHERNHRKILVIDDRISYLGSANITAACLEWRELALRLDDSISVHFRDSFLNQWHREDNISFKKIKFMFHKGFEIIHDIPADKEMLAASRYVKIINRARREILIETPYFIPPIRLRKSLYRALKRGVKVTIILPCNSDVTILDIVRNRYLGKFYKRGAHILYYTKGILHSKLIIVDRKYFILGSSNLDYRSFLHMHEINLLGKNKEIIQSLLAYFDSGLKDVRPFSYQEWKSRSSIKKILELLGSLVDTYL
jgi:cardiolipin synthase